MNALIRAIVQRWQNLGRPGQLGGALLCLAPLLGYLWPVSEPLNSEATSQGWQWPARANEGPASQQLQSIEPFWPMSADAKQRQQQTDEADAASSAAQANQQAQWALIGVIRQGHRLSGLVINPDQKLLTLHPGMMLDADRKVIRIDMTQLHWQQADGRTGKLTLYPALPANATTSKPSNHPQSSNQADHRS